MDRGGQDCPGSCGAAGTTWVDMELGWGAGEGSGDISANQIIMKVSFLYILVSAGGGKHPSVSPQEPHGPALGGRTVRAG